MSGLGQSESQDLARFLGGLAAFLDDADPYIAQAFAEHYGFEQAIDWVIVMLEAHAGRSTHRDQAQHGAGQ